jgi:hypothetical protein
VVLQKLSATVDVEHLNYFHPESPSLLVRSCGFEVLEVQTPDKPDAELVRKKVPLRRRLQDLKKSVCAFTDRVVWECRDLRKGGPAQP